MKNNWSDITQNAVPQYALKAYGALSVLYNAGEDQDLIVAGYASPQVVDREKHLITKKALFEDLDRFLAVPEYRNAMLLHSNVQVGTVLPFWTNPQTGETYTTHVDEIGLFAVIKVRTDKYRPNIVNQVIKDVQEGKIASFSISADAPFDSRRYECVDGTCFWVIDKIEYYEITLCETPVNQDANFTILSKSIEDEFKASSFCQDGSCPIVETSYLSSREKLAYTLRKAVMNKAPFGGGIGGFKGNGVAEPIKPIPAAKPKEAVDPRKPDGADVGARAGGNKAGAVKRVADGGANKAIDDSELELHNTPNSPHKEHMNGPSAQQDQPQQPMQQPQQQEQGFDRQGVMQKIGEMLKDVPAKFAEKVREMKDELARMSPQEILDVADAVAHVAHTAVHIAPHVAGALAPAASIAGNGLPRLFGLSESDNPALRELSEYMLNNGYIKTEDVGPLDYAGATDGDDESEKYYLNKGYYVFDDLQEFLEKSIPLTSSSLLGARLTLAAIQKNKLSILSGFSNISKSWVVWTDNFPTSINKAYIGVGEVLDDIAKSNPSLRNDALILKSDLAARFPLRGSTATKAVDDLLIRTAQLAKALDTIGLELSREGIDLHMEKSYNVGWVNTARTAIKNAVEALRLHVIDNAQGRVLLNSEVLSNVDTLYNDMQVLADNLGLGSELEKFKLVADKPQIDIVNQVANSTLKDVANANILLEKIDYDKDELGDAAQQFVPNNYAVKTGVSNSLN